MALSVASPARTNRLSSESGKPRASMMARLQPSGFSASRARGTATLVVAARDHFAIDRARPDREPLGRRDNRREAVAPVPTWKRTDPRSPSRRAIMRKPSCAISWSQSGPAGRERRTRSGGVMLSGGAERFLVRAEASSLDTVSAALHAEAAEVASSCNRRHSRSYSHSRHRIRRPALVFGRAAVVRHFRCRRHKTSPN
jgi:hypothetical protein